MKSCAYHSLIQNGGITNCSDYMYTATWGVCNTVKTTHRWVIIISYVHVTPYNESALMNAVASQPVSVAIEASSLSFQLYSIRIFTDTCRTNVDHGVIIVGYNNNASPHCWIVKNSWGTSWEEFGYIRMKKDITSTACIYDIAIEPTYPTMWFWK